MIAQRGVGYLAEEGLGADRIARRADAVFPPALGVHKPR
jgi:hypothetical protein